MVVQLDEYQARAGIIHTKQAWTLEFPGSVILQKELNRLVLSISEKFRTLFFFIAIWSF